MENLDLNHLLGGLTMGMGNIENMAQFNCTVVELCTQTNRQTCTERERDSRLQCPQK